MELYHYGVKGQKWGVRRYQNPDGSLTDAGKKRYSEVTAKQKKRKKAGKIFSYVGDQLIMRGNDYVGYFFKTIGIGFKVSSLSIESITAGRKYCNKN